MENLLGIKGNKALSLRGDRNPGQHKTELGLTSWDLIAESLWLPHSLSVPSSSPNAAVLPHSSVQENPNKRLHNISGRQQKTKMVREG